MSFISENFSIEFTESLIYTGLGLILMILAFIIIDLLTPGNLRKQLVEEKNVALAILVGAALIGVSIIIGAAING